MLKIKNSLSLSAFLFAVCSVLATDLAVAQTPELEILGQGARLYAQHCASCHESPDERTPGRDQLLMTDSPDMMMLSMTSGVMREQTSHLSDDEKVAVVAFLLGEMPGNGIGADITAFRCTEAPGPMSLNGSHWNGWGGTGSRNARFQPEAGLTAEDVPNLKLKWAFAVPGGAFTPPAVVGGRLFQPSKSGVVYALDADSGCAYWAAKIDASVRASVVVGALPSGKFAVYVADRLGDIHALDADTGSEIWQTNVEDHPMVRMTGAPVLFDGRLYVPVSSFEEHGGRQGDDYLCCTFRGSVAALDAVTGEMLWKTYMIDAMPEPRDEGRRIGPAGVAVWSAPTVDADRGLVYVGTGQAYSRPVTPESDAVVALDLESGAKRWVRPITPDDAYMVSCRNQSRPACPEGDLGPDYDIGSSPIMVTLPDGKDRLIVASKSGEVLGLDPDDQGRILWRTQVGAGGTQGGILWGGASDHGSRVFATVSDIGIWDDDPAAARPGINAVSTVTGEHLWHVPAPQPPCSWGEDRCTHHFASAPAAIPGVIFAGAWDGYEYAFAADTGEILWKFDSGTTFDAVGGKKVAGRLIYHGGQTVANGTLYLNSGVPWIYLTSALLAFSADGD